MIGHSVLPGNQSFGHPDFFWTMSDVRRQNESLPTFPIFFVFTLEFLDRLDYCTTPGIGVGGSVGVSKILKFYFKVFYVMDKALSGEQSCPCDRSCYQTLHVYYS